MTIWKFSSLKFRFVPKIQKCILYNIYSFKKICRYRPVLHTSFRASSLVYHHCVISQQVHKMQAAQWHSWQLCCLPARRSLGSNSQPGLFLNTIESIDNRCMGGYINYIMPLVVFNVVDMPRVALLEGSTVSLTVSCTLKHFRLIFSHIVQSMAIGAFTPLLAVDIEVSGWFEALDLTLN